MSIRCAIYARYSSDRQNPLSIDDQVRQCRAYVRGKGWTLDEAHVYLDEAKSGRNEDRSGFQALCEAVRGKDGGQPWFDCILVDDTSRISRNQGDALRFYERLAFAGVRLIAVSQGLDSSSEQAELMLGVHGLIDSAYSRELAQKTHRGMSGAALRGGATGGRCFGFRTITETNAANGETEPSIRETTAKHPGTMLAIYEPEAAIVRRIFAMSASGVSVKKIARALNAEGIASARAYRGQRHASWAAAAVSVMLRNERYKGSVTWNRTRKVRNPETGRRIQRLRPRAEWMTSERPELRIVEPALWQRVQERLARMRAPEAACMGGRRANYLLSGLLECGACGSKMVIVSAGKAAWSKYGCPLAVRGVCGMKMRIARESMERRLLEALAAAMNAAGMEKLILARVEKERARVEAMGAKNAHARAALKERIDRLADLIAAGNHSPALTERLRSMEEEWQAEAGRASSGWHNAAVRECGDLQGIMMADRAKAKDLLLRSVRVTAACEPVRGVTCAVWGNAGGRNRTAHASLFRAALYH